MDNWKIYAFVAGAVIFIAVIGLGFYGLFSGKGFSDLPVKDWTVQEAIFYGFCLLSLVTLIRGN